MDPHDTVTEGLLQWRTAAEGLLHEAERAGSHSNFLSGLDDQAAADVLDARVDNLLAAGDIAFHGLHATDDPTTGSRFQAVSLLVGSLTISEALAVADETRDSTASLLTVPDARTTAFARARTTVREATVLVDAPTALTDALDTLQDAGATESWKVLSGGAGKFAGTALVTGLHDLLRGSAAAAFDDLLEHPKRWRDALKRNALRIARWVVQKVRSLLPRALEDKLEELLEGLQDIVEEGFGQAAIEQYGLVLGRRVTEERWRSATSAETRIAEKLLPSVTSEHSARIAWVTQARGVLERYDTITTSAVIGSPAPVKIGLAALVVAVLAFVAVQVDDGFDEIGALV